MVQVDTMSKGKVNGIKERWRGEVPWFSYFSANHAAIYHDRAACAATIRLPLMAGLCAERSTLSGGELKAIGELVLA